MPGACRRAALGPPLRILASHKRRLHAKALLVSVAIPLDPHVKVLDLLRPFPKAWRRPARRFTSSLIRTGRGRDRGSPSTRSSRGCGGTPSSEGPRAACVSTDPYLVSTRGIREVPSKLPGEIGTFAEAPAGR